MPNLLTHPPPVYAMQVPPHASVLYMRCAEASWQPLQTTPVDPLALVGSGLDSGREWWMLVDMIVPGHVVDMSVPGHVMDMSVAV
jgi:hypothetical protein